jgi:hypothetical protein
MSFFLKKNCLLFPFYDLIGEVVILLQSIIITYDQNHTWSLRKKLYIFFHVFILVFPLMILVHLSLDGSFVARVDLPFVHIYTLRLLFMVITKVIVLWSTFASLFLLYF